MHKDGKGPQPGTKMLTRAGVEAEEPEDWTAWMKAYGYAMCFRQIPAQKAVKTSNAFAALTSEPDVPDPPGLAAPTPRVSLSAAFGALRKCCGLTMSQCRYISGSETSVEQVAVHADEAWHAETTQLPRPYRPKYRPMAAGWEKLQKIVDSVASFSVVPPGVGRDY